MQLTYDLSAAAKSAGAKSGVVGGGGGGGVLSLPPITVVDSLAVRIYSTTIIITS